MYVAVAVFVARVSVTEVRRSTGINKPMQSLRPSVPRIERGESDDETIAVEILYDLLALP